MIFCDYGKSGTMECFALRKFRIYLSYGGSKLFSEFIDPFNEFSLEISIAPSFKKYLKEFYQAFSNKNYISTEIHGTVLHNRKVTAPFKASYSLELYSAYFYISKINLDGFEEHVLTAEIKILRDKKDRDKMINREKVLESFNEFFEKLTMIKI